MKIKKAASAHMRWHKFVLVISIGFICVVGESYVIHLGRVVGKPVNANPGLKVNQGNNYFSSIKMLSIAYVLCS